MAKDANLGITAHNPTNPIATSYLRGNIPAEAATAIANQHGSHQPTDTNAADPALFTADMKLGAAAQALGDAVLADGNAEAPHYDQFGNKTA